MNLDQIVPFRGMIGVAESHPRPRPSSQQRGRPQTGSPQPDWVGPPKKTRSLLVHPPRAQRPAHTDRGTNRVHHSTRLYRASSPEHRPPVDD